MIFCSRPQSLSVISSSGLDGIFPCRIVKYNKVKGFRTIQISCATFHIGRLPIITGCFLIWRVSAMLDFIKGNGSEQKSISSLSILENSIGKGYPGLNCTVHLIVILCLLYSIGSCCAVVFCPDDRYLMPINNSLPWGAIGYMDNGCTATLLDPSHIVAAAHCFCFDDTGSWQNNLSFYPNFNPKRPNSPSVAIDRAVVGTRVRTGGEFQASDWGIGHLAKEVKDFPAMQADFKSNSAGIIDVMSAGYGRDLFFFGVGQARLAGSARWAVMSGGSRH